MPHSKSKILGHITSNRGLGSQLLVVKSELLDTNNDVCDQVISLRAVDDMYKVTDFDFYSNTQIKELISILQKHLKESEDA